MRREMEGFLKITIKRRITQFVSLILLNSRFAETGFSTGWLCIPVLNCGACAVSWLGCPIGLMSDKIAFHAFPLLVLGIVFGIAVLAGRFLCGWVCPMGLLQDLLYKIPMLKIRLPSFLRYLKYVFLLLAVVAVAYFIGKEPPFAGLDNSEPAETPAKYLLFFCRYCPTAALEVALPDMIRFSDYLPNAERILRFSVLAIVIVLAVMNHRSFCKIMCPIGAMVALGNKISLFSLRFNRDKCIDCLKCSRECCMDVNVHDRGKDGKTVSRHGECIECLKCQEVCPTAAISNNSKIIG